MQYLHAYLKWEITGIAGIHAIPIIFMCILQGTFCDTGIHHNFYGENICSVDIKFEKNDFNYLSRLLFLSQNYILAYNCSNWRKLKYSNCKKTSKQKWKQKMQFLMYRVSGARNGWESSQMPTYSSSISFFLVLALEYSNWKKKYHLTIVRNWANRQGSQV